MLPQIDVATTGGEQLVLMRFFSLRIRKVIAHYSLESKSKIYSILYPSSKCKDGGNLEGPHSRIDSILALHPVAWGLILGVPKNFSELLMLLRLINGAAA